MIRMIRILLLVLSVIGLGLVLWTPSAIAQSPYELKAEVDATDVTTDDTVTLTLTLTTPDENPPRLSLLANSLAMDGFKVVGSQTSSQYSVVNGTASATMRYQYELQPTRTGDLGIPSFRLEMGGQTISTDALTVFVRRGNGTPTIKKAQSSSPFSGLMGNDPFSDPFFGDPLGSDLFSNRGDLNIQAATTKKSVYVGEPLEYVVRVASDAMLLGAPEYQAPTFTGFWVHPPIDTRQAAQASEIATLLFPTKAGSLTIEPAAIRVEGGFFSNAIERETEPVTVEVKPLPQGAPAEFNGAVGQFEITATPDKRETRVGEPITVRVEIRGTGNFDTLADPRWAQDANWRAFDAKGETKSAVQNGTLVGTKTYERTLIPTTQGNLKIPATTFVYFDPRDEKYRTLAADAMEIKVAAGDPSVAQGAMDASASAGGGTTDAANAPALKGAQGTLMAAAKPLVEQPQFLALFLVPLGVLAIDIGLGLRKRYLDANAAELRASRALKNARRKLKRAARDKNVSMAAAQVMEQFIEDKANRALLGVSHSAVAQLLGEHGVSQEVIQDVMVLLLAGESSVFGNLYQATTAQTIADADGVLRALEGEWKE